MYRRINRDKKINLKVPSSDNIYVDLVIPNDDSEKQLQTSFYQIKRQIDILPKASDYYISIDELSLPSDVIPLYVLIGRDPTEAGYQVGDLDYFIELRATNTDDYQIMGDDVVARSYLNYVNYNYQSSNTLINEETLTINIRGQERVIFLLYNLDAFLDLVNLTLGNVTLDYATQLDLVAGPASYWDPNTNAGASAMFLQLTEENNVRMVVASQIIGVQTPVPDRYNGGVATGVNSPTTNFGFSDSLWFLLPGFGGNNEQIDSFGRQIYSLYIGGFQWRDSFNDTATEVRNPGQLAIPTQGYTDTNTMYQTFFLASTKFTANQELPKIVVEVGIIPTQRNLNGNEKSGSEQYVLTFIPNNEQLNFSNYIFKPLNASKLVDLLSEHSLTELSFKFYWLDFLGNKYEIYIPIYKSVDMRLLFIKKQLFNNFYRSDEPI